MGGVFISYRRADSQGSTGRLYDRLHQLLGSDVPLFVDIDSIKPGQDFRQVITDTLDRCDVTLVMIGPRWASIEDENGTRRLHDPADLHRLEVESALASSSTTIPVLVEGATMPSAEELPESIQSLAFLHAAEVSVRRFSSDTAYLADMIRAEFSEGRAGGDMALGAPPPTVEPPPAETVPVAPDPDPEPEPAATVAPVAAPGPSTPTWVWGALAGAAAVIVALAVIAFTGGSDDAETVEPPTTTVAEVADAAEDTIVNTVLVRDTPLVVPDVSGLPAGLWREEANLQGVVFEGDTTQITFRAAHYVSTAAAIMRNNPNVALDVAVITFSDDPAADTQLAADRAAQFEAYLAGWMGDTSQLTFVAEIEAPPPGRAAPDGRIQFRTPGGGTDDGAVGAAGIGANLLALQLREESFMLGWGNFEMASGEMTDFGASILTNVGQSIAQARQNVTVTVWTYNTVADAESVAAARASTVQSVLDEAGATSFVTVEGRVGNPGYARAPVDGQFTLIVDG